MRILFFLFLTCTFCNLIAQSSDAILGKWWTEEKKGVVEVFKKDGYYYGKLVKIEDPYDENGKPRLDTKNPIEKYRTRQIEGMTFMFKFKYDERSQKWEGGKIYDPESGNTYDGYLKLKSKDILDLRGYMGVTWLGRTSTWERYKQG